MRRSELLMILFTLLVITACGKPAAPSSLPLSLPTAVPPPEGPAGGGWGISFQHEFPAGFWPEGIHRYGFRLQCPVALTEAQDFSSNWQEFQTTEAIQPQIADTVAYFRLNGISRHPFSPAVVQPIVHPQQPTTAIIHLLGLTREAAEAAKIECEVLFAWDQGAIQPLTPLEPFQP